MARLLLNWVDSFLDLTANTGSPELFRQWTAISIIASTLERRVWVDVGLGSLYPNLYIFLVAPPGVGKSVLTSLAYSLLNNLSTGADDGLRLSSSSLTSASLVDELKEAERKVWTTGIEYEKYNSLAICVNELGVLLPVYDTAMMNTLTDIYDGTPYSESRRTKDIKRKIERPQLNILTGTTPGHLTNMLPEGAWDQGFLSRTLLIFNAESAIRPLFETVPEKSKLRKSLEHDLAEIFSLWGEVAFSPEAKQALIEWHTAGGPPTPDHPRLVNYNTRRTAHLLKLCMVACFADGDKRVIELWHYQRALEWLLSAERFMPDIFKAMVVNPDMKAMDECWHFFWQVYMRDGQKPIHESRIIAFLQERVPSQNVLRMLEVMVKMGIFVKELTTTGEGYKPKPRRAT